MGSTARTIPPSRMAFLAMVMDSIDQLNPVELLVIEDFLARKRAHDQTSSNTAAAGDSAGVVPMVDVQAECTGSQPIESPLVLDHVTEVEKTWVYEDDEDYDMLDQQWIEILNANDDNLQSFSSKFTFLSFRVESPDFAIAKEYEVDIDAMTSTNKEKKKRHVPCTACSCASWG